MYDFQGYHRLWNFVLCIREEPLVSWSDVGFALLYEHNSDITQHTENLILVIDEILKHFLIQPNIFQNNVHIRNIAIHFTNHPFVEVC